MPDAVLQDALLNIFYIGFSTKLLLNDSNKIKNPICAHLQSIDNLFQTRYQYWSVVYGHNFGETRHTSFLQTHKMIRKLNEGLDSAQFNKNVHTKAWTNQLKMQKEKEPKIESYS